MSTARLPVMNNNLFMSDKPPHITYVRLLAALTEQQKLAEPVEPTAAARLLGVSLQTLTNWRIRRVSDEGVIKAAIQCGVRVAWITEGRPPMLESGDGLSVIYRWDVGGSMGRGLALPNQPGVIESVKVSPEWLARNISGNIDAQNLAIVTGFGDSMRPVFGPGDPLVVDTSAPIWRGDGVYFFRVDDEGYIKRLHKTPRGITVISANKEYPPWDITPEMEFELFARVLKVWRSEDP